MWLGVVLICLPLLSYGSDAESGNGGQKSNQCAVNLSRDGVRGKSRSPVMCHGTMIKFDCDPLDPLACNRRLLEVCVFRNSTYQCECPPNYSRLPDGKCLVTNECFEPKLNDCSEDATCTDTLESYICACKPGFIDFSPDPTQKPGRICKKDVNECLNPDKFGVSCDRNAQCHDTETAYKCVCNTGYVDVSEKYGLPQGRKCELEYDPCSSVATNDCSKNAVCSSDKNSYTCQCKSGFEDVSPSRHYPGRDCRPISEQQIDSSTSHVTVSKLTCNITIDNTTVTDWCACPNDCCHHANCITKRDSYDCECKPGFIDVSPDANKRGRYCVTPEDRCTSRDKNDCSPFAKCIPSVNNFTCQCLEGYLDVSSQWNQLPGRTCVKEKHECSDPTLNSCDENANCIKKPDGYACLCQKGYHDVSSSANLKPGRVCTLVTNCPKQPTDLMFLIDGSLSIGREVFKKEVLRFVRNFVTLFTIAPNQTRVAVIQFSHLVRKEIKFNQYTNLQDLQQAVDNIKYLRGMTRTGVAISFMMREGFKPGDGSRWESKDVQKVAVVITDGMAQDSVRDPAARARRQGVKLFAVGVTEHVRHEQLVQITGCPKKVFLVGTFKDLNTRLRAVMQKELCPKDEIGPNMCPNCDASRNYVCVNNTCVCPEGFCEDPVKKVCGSKVCNPDLASITCPYPMICKETPYKTYRCACPQDHTCHLNDSSCISNTTQICPDNQKWNPFTKKCEGCNPPCETAKNQVCLKSPTTGYYCGCKDRHVLDPVTQICAVNECLIPGLNNCSENADCQDTLEGHFCTCKRGYNDESPRGKSGIICNKIKNPCETKRHDCSSNAECIPNLLGGFTCKCKPGYVDQYPPIPGRQCEHRENECEYPEKNNCSVNANCYDLDVGYRCVCRSGFQDLETHKNPGRVCLIDPCQNPVSNNCWLKRCRILDIYKGKFMCEPCPSGYYDADPTKPGRLCKPKIYPCTDSRLNNCDPNAFCTSIKGSYEKYTCQCRDGYIDVSKDAINRPGRKCELIKNQCFDATKNDCDLQAVCIDLRNNMYNCACRDGYLDKSRDPQKPGRICKKLVNECSIPHLNNCSAHAQCIDQPEGYKCQCLNGYKDKSPTDYPGRICVYIPDPCSSISLNDCDVRAKCTRVGLEQYECQCIKPYKDNSSDPKMPGRRCIYDGCSSKDTNTCDKNAECINGDGYINCRCKDGYIDADSLNPGFKCVPEPLCGGKRCDKSLGLSCDQSQQMCKCKEGWYQKSEGAKCVETVPVDLYLWVARRNEVYFTYSNDWANLTNPTTEEMVAMFVDGIGKTFAATPLSKYYLTNQIRAIQNPADRRVKWNQGLWIEFTCFFEKVQPSYDQYATWRTMVDTIKRQFNYSVGGTELYINEYQLPFACYQNECDQNADCFEKTPTSYTCQCYANFVDSDPENPGHKCDVITTTASTTTTTTAYIDPCRLKNACDPVSSTCVPLESGLYDCQCNEGYYSNGTKKALTSTNDINSKFGKGPVHITQCYPDFCSDFPDCPSLNGTCKNYEDHAQCECNETYVDLRQAQIGQRRICHGDTFCMKKIDVDFCCLQMHSCHPSALCVAKPGGGYQCQCETDGRTVADGSPCSATPKALSSIKMKLEEYCDLCNNQGACVMNKNNGADESADPICECYTWYFGSTCALDIRIVILLILMALLAIVSSFIIAYVCMKWCQKRQRNYSDIASYISERASTPSIYANLTIPRPRLKPDDLIGCGSILTLNDCSADNDGTQGHDNRATSTMTRDEQQGAQDNLSRYLDPSLETMPGGLAAFREVVKKTFSNDNKENLSESPKIESTSQLAEWDEITIENNPYDKEKLVI